MHTLDAFYPLRNHLIDFLVRRFTLERVREPATVPNRYPPLVALDAAALEPMPLRALKKTVWKCAVTQRKANA
ncbi:MAG: hypothetical protein JWO65_1591 [Sphingomonas bacterium]|jgi:hypothetical protein|nr:hypothetical protein [Sphingomonas bacterium]